MANHIISSDIRRSDRGDAYTQKTRYQATLSFALEDDKADGLSEAMGLASQSVLILACQAAALSLAII
jgi:hypothetical protein